MADPIEWINQLYDAFNARDIEALLSKMSNDVVWANGMDGGYVHGREGVRSYWTRQWQTIDPRVEPIRSFVGPEGEIVVEVHQVVRDREGRLLTEKTVGHVFRMENGVITRFDIRGS